MRGKAFCKAFCLWGFLKVMTSKVLPSCWSNSHSVVVTSFSDSDGVGVGVVVIDVPVVVLMLPSLLSIVVTENDEELDVSSSSGGNVGKEIDTLEPFEAVDFDSLSSSSSSSKGDLPTTLVPSLLLSTPGVSPPPPPPAPPPRRLRRTTGPRTRMTSEIIELTFVSIL